MAARLRQVSFSYDGSAWALHGIDLDIRIGEWVCLTGPNGSGKSTLARILAGLSAPDDGMVRLMGEPVFDEDGAHAQRYRAARRHIGAVFQNPEDQIVTTLVEDDVAFGPENLGYPRERIGTAIHDSLRAVGLWQWRRADPTRMSGGQQQRVAIAGAMAMMPRMIVLDEPTAMLDPSARDEVMEVLSRWHRQGATVVHVTHRHDEARRAQRIVRLEAGRIVDIGDAVNTHTPSADITITGSIAAEDGSAAETHRTLSHINKTCDEKTGTAKRHTGQPCGQPHAHDDDTAHHHGLTPCHHGTSSASDMEIERRHPLSPAPERGSSPHHIAALRAAPPWNDTDTHEEHSPQKTPGTHGTHIAARDGDAPTPWAIAAEHLTHRYGTSCRLTLQDYSLHVRQGQTVALMGVNGSGKTTLARLLCALDRPTSGSIHVCGVPVAGRRRFMARRGPRMANARQRTELRRMVGYVMQHPERQLFAGSVAEDIAFGPKNQGLSDAEVSHRVSEAMDLLDIGHLAHRSPHDLSGGQQRLASIAGVIACHPRVLILDEPTANLDAEATARIHALLRTLRTRKVTILLITHDEREARQLADRVDTLEASAQNSHGPSSDTTGDAPPHGPTRPDTARHDPTRDIRSDHALREGRMPAGADDSPAAWSMTATSSPSLSSPLAHLDTRVSILVFLTLMCSAFAITTIAQLMVAAAMTLAMAVAGRIGPSRLFGATRGFLAMFAFTGLFNIALIRSGTVWAQWGPMAITADGMMACLLVVCRFALVVFLGTIAMATTTPIAVADACRSLMSPLERLGVHTQDIALVMSLAMRFLPTLSQEAHAIVDAQACRGGSIETGGPLRRIHAMTSVIVPVFAATLRHADNLALALDARSYESGTARTHWRVTHARARDVVLILGAVAYVASLVVAATPWR